jgi:ADP-ribosylglycohydrolase
LDIRNQILGCIFGGAIGDAMGSSVEGQSAPGVSLALEWTLTDDTQLTLATCEAIVENQHVDPEAIANRMAQWFSLGRVTRVGASTFAALRSLVNGGHWALVGARGERAAGNGAAMRVAPIAFVLDPSNDADRRTIRDVCRITHHSDEAYVGGLAVISAIRFSANGEWTGTPDLVMRVAKNLPDSRVRDRLIELGAVGPRASVREVATRFGTSGFVADSIPLALLAAQHVSDLGFERMMNDVVSVGGDTDTTASIAGQIAGAFFGYSKLPPHLLHRLPSRDLIQTIGDEFAKLVLSIIS